MFNSLISLVSQLQKLAFVLDQVRCQRLCESLRAVHHSALEGLAHRVIISLSSLLLLTVVNARAHFSEIRAHFSPSETSACTSIMSCAYHSISVWDFRSSELICGARIQSPFAIQSIIHRLVVVHQLIQVHSTPMISSLLVRGGIDGSGPDAALPRISNASSTKERIIQNVVILGLIGLVLILPLWIRCPLPALPAGKPALLLEAQIRAHIRNIILAYTGAKDRHRGLIMVQGTELPWARASSSALA